VRKVNDLEYFTRASILKSLEPKGAKKPATKRKAGAAGAPEDDD